MAAVQAEVRELIHHLETEGYTVEINGGPKAKVLRDGEPVLDKRTHKVITLPLTPSDHRWRKNTMASLIRNEVLAADPKKVGQSARPHRMPSETQTPEAKAKRIEGLNRLKESRRESTKLLAEHFKTVLAPLGVWKPNRKGAGGWKRSIGEVARIVYWWSNERLEDWPPSEPAALSAMNKLYHGDVVGEEVAETLDRFIRELEVSTEPAKLYSEWVLLMQGITIRHVEPLPEADIVEIEQNVPEVGVIAVKSTQGKPQLALRALAQMARHAQDEAEIDYAVMIAQEILDIEWSRLNNGRST